MKDINEIISKYTGGGATAEETNAALTEAGAGFHLEPGRNTLTEAEKLATTVGWYPSQANGFGLLNSGTGTLDKVEVRDGQLVNCDMGESYAELHIAGKHYYIQGKALTETPPEAPDPAPVLPRTPDMRRRMDLAGQTVEQRCRAGLFAVTYDEDGYAVKAARVEG